MRPVPDVLGVLLLAVLLPAIALLAAVAQFPGRIPVWVVLSILIPATLVIFASAAWIALPGFVARAGPTHEGSDVDGAALR